MNNDQNSSMELARKELAKRANQRVWELIAKPGRTKTEAEDMLLAAYASLYLWKELGTAVNVQRGCWLVAKVHISLGQTADAIHWAESCQQITEENPGEMEDFDLAYTEEVLARAYALAGMDDRSRQHHSAAAALGVQIADPEDREIFQTDFTGGNWYQLTGE